MLHVFILQDGKFRKLTRVEEYEKHQKTASFTWIEGSKLTPEEQSTLSFYLGIDSKSLTRVLEQPSRGRYHRFYDTSALHIPILVAEPLIRTEHSLILIGEKIIATISDHLSPDSINEVEETLRNFVETGQSISPSLVAVRVVQEIVELNTAAIQQIVTPAMEMEKQLGQIDLKSLVSEIASFRQTQSIIFHHLMEQRNIVDLILQHVPRHLQLDEQLTNILYMVQNDLERHQQTLELQSRGLTDLVSLQNILLANKLNRAIVILTAITVTVTLPSLIANIFGMWGVFSSVPIFIILGVIPIYAWQIELLFLIPAVIIPIIWVIRKGWVKL
jgi:Mg2+ and Co2+ transporter CorA